eukprot:gnl/Spiro4/16361_TR8781_c0_g1_i1.p1 gnl/Spiro4/16361_TR8781_c0_g1~~gnl/Spiro4/16361_TR8781_c0_g1_i1.p1  ORF type:complete len:333 (+),score=39.25 gnl/Spiro4/16361_TR8781_c0_g1_i1:64-999(+)
MSVREETFRGLPCTVAQLDSGTSITVLHHGATLVSYRSHGSEILFVSEKSFFQPPKAIRGGVPICFPWFGPRDGAPQHGFARNVLWSPVRAETQPETASVIVEFALRRTDVDTSLHPHWTHDFAALFRVVLSSSQLAMELEVVNPGHETIGVSPVLHTYFRVPHIASTSLMGLQSQSYTDKVLGGTVHVQSEAALRFTSETDRVYSPAISTCATTFPRSVEICMGSGPDCSLNSNSNSNLNFPASIRVALTSASTDYVVWNPWEGKASTLADFSTPEFQQMLCVEAGSALAAVSIPASGSASFGCTIAPIW